MEEMDQKINISTTPPEMRGLRSTSSGGTSSGGSSNLSQYGAIEKEEKNKLLDQQLGKLNVFTRLVTVFYAFLALSVLVLLILGLLDLFDTFFALLAIAGLTIVGGVAGAVGVYKFGSVMSQINRLEKENEKFESEIEEMKQNVDELSGSVQSIQSDVSDLRLDAKELEGHMGEFDELRTALGDVASANEEINSVVQSLNDMYTNMENVILENEKAALWAMYYDVEMMDSSEGLSKREYDRFLGRLTDKQRERFEKLGSFAQVAGPDENLDRDEFQQLVEQVLDQMDGEVSQQIGNV